MAVVFGVQGSTGRRFRDCARDRDGLGCRLGV